MADEQQEIKVTILLEDYLKWVESEDITFIDADSREALIGGYHEIV